MALLHFYPISIHKLFRKVLLQIVNPQGQVHVKEEQSKLEIRQLNSLPLKM
ncbi:unnamed protein product [Trichobilharzia regenti]|nr:unnamed protein product [Trichobilharzia regenti]